MLAREDVVIIHRNFEGRVTFGQGFGHFQVAGPVRIYKEKIAQPKDATGNDTPKGTFEASLFHHSQRQLCWL